MELRTFHTIVTDKGEQTCGDIGVSADEWLDLLRKEQARRYIETLSYLLREQGHKASCTMLSAKYGEPSQHYNGKVTGFAKWVQKELNRFNIKDTEGDNAYWCIPMEKGRHSPKGFIWLMRNELVEALQMYLMESLIHQFESSKSSASINEMKGEGFYDDELYQIICNYFGIECEDIDKRPKHFTEIINGFAAKYGNKVQEILRNKAPDYNNKSLGSAIQALFRYMKEYMKKMESTKNIEATRTYWLVGFSFGGNDSQIERFFKNNIWEGGFDNSDRQLQLVQSIKKGDILILKSVSTKGEKHDVPFLRIKGVGIVESDMSSKQKTDSSTLCSCDVKYIKVDGKDFVGSDYGGFRKTVHKANRKAQPIIDYVNSLLCTEGIGTPSEYAEYIELLKETHNLVLTGAPGTGKTYMAQRIAKDMGCTKDEMCFVQFHPSYDYTDFVEGLRPIENSDGQIGFERRDGVFKDFCKRAVKNLIDSKKSVESLTNELSWEERLQQFIEIAIENNTIFNLSVGSEFTIDEIRQRTIIIHNEQNKKTKQIAVNADEIIELLANDVQLDNVKDIRDYFKRKFPTQADSYTFIIVKAIRNMKTPTPDAPANKVERKPFVFIIDEINRGEVSKIFGELFYAIDPGYRGNNDVRVKTQYQNLVPDTDVFAEGFYVPENVYILATMNDIDRSVESMDFAMRRRFTWKEVLPADTDDMLDVLDCADKAKATMNRLNEVISTTDGLGTAYQVGPSYFLKLRDNGNDFDKLWKMNIEPLLKEYLRGFRMADEILKKLNRAYFADETAEEN